MATQEEIQAKAATLNPEQKAAIDKQVSAMKPGELEARVQNSVENPTQAPVVAPVEPSPVETPVETPVQAPTSPVLPKEVAKTEVKAPEKPIMSDKEEFELGETKKQVTQQERQAKLDGFRSLLEENADRAEMAKYVNENPDLRTQFGLQAKNFYKTKQNADFQMKYASASPKALYDAYINSDIVVGSSEYNMLPPETKSAFEQYKAQKDITMTQEELQTSLANDQTKILETPTIKEPVFAGTDIRATYDKLINSPEITAKRTEVEGLATELGTLQNDINAIEDDIIAEYEGSGRSQSFINAKIAKEQRVLQKQYNNVSVQYQNSLASFQDMKSDVEREMKYVEFEEERAFQNYQIELGQYNADRSRMDAFAMAEFQRKNQELAAQRQQEFTMEMKRIDQDFALKNEKPTYQIARDGKMYAIIDGKAQEVMTLGGELLFGDETEEYSSDIRYNDDGTITEVKVYKDGRSPFISTYDAQGNKVTGAPDALQAFIEKCRVTGQCGAGANDYAQQLGMGRIFGDSYASKMKNVDSQDPQIGGFAVWNPSQGQGKYSEYGHVGIVTGYNRETGKVTINDWNYDGDEKQKTHEVNLSEITFNGGFVTPNTDKFAPQVAVNQADVPLYKKYLNGDLTAADQKTIEDIDSFKAEAVKYQEELTAQGTPQIEKLINLAKDLRDNAPGRSGRIAADTSIGRTVSSDLADYQANYDAFISNNALDQLVTLKSNGATFGALSDKELQFIQSSATNLRANLSDEAFKSELDRIINTLSLGLSDEATPTPKEETDIPMTPITTVRGYYKVKGKYNTTGLPQ